MPRIRAQLWLGAAAVAVALAAGAAVSLAAGSSLTAQPKPPIRPGAGAPAIVRPLFATLAASNVPSLRVASTATGQFIGGLGRGGILGRGELPNLSWSLFWVVGVRNATGPITGVEIRSGEVSAAAAPVVLTLCSPCRSTSAASLGAPAGTVAAGSISNLTPAQLTTLRQSQLYVNVKTAANPAGELRGAITRRGQVAGPLPNNRMPNPLKPGPPQPVSGP